MGVLRTDADLEKIVIRYYNPTTMDAVALNAPGNIIEVAVESVEHNWLIPLWWGHEPLYLSARSSDRMEGLPGGSSPPAR
jgi:hypothetical protein